MILAAITWTGLARAENAGDLSGFYSYSDVSVSGDTATLALTFRLFNHGSADISNATVVMRNWIIPNRNYGSFANVSISAGQMVQLSGIFQVPKSEYQTWQEGRSPSLIIEYPNPSGTKKWRPIKLARDR